MITLTIQMMSPITPPMHPRLFLPERHLAPTHRTDQCYGGSRQQVPRDLHTQDTDFQTGLCGTCA